MYYSSERQKHSELNSLQKLYAIFASCHITDVREVEVEKGKHEYCWLTNKERKVNRCIPEPTFPSDGLKTGTKAGAERYGTDTEKINPLVTASARDFFIFQLSQRSLPAHFPSPKASTWNSCFPLLRPCVSSGVLVSIQLHPRQPSKQQLHLCLQFLCLKCSICFPPSSTVVAQNMNKAGWLEMPQRGHLLPGSFEQNVKYFCWAGYSFQRGWNSYWAIAALELCYFPFNKSYWQWLQQRMLCTVTEVKCIWTTTIHNSCKIWEGNFTA